ncbi:MAG: hypothetical protein SAK29_09325 [Scytonema sp. PMC 1069.18]|nr:hypothetical protein [Scytonema sp. PMC 1069.18]MEC4885697.1 hypothetical protein [Scytonema sp. PMC 1070.18]
MLNQNRNLNLLREALSQLCDVVDQLIEQDRRIHNIERKSAIHDGLLSKQESRLSLLEKKYEALKQIHQNQQLQIQSQYTQLQKNEESIHCLEEKIPYFRHLACRNEELESELAFLHTPD